MSENNFLQSNAGKLLFPFLSMIQSEYKKEEQIQKFRYLNPNQGMVIVGGVGIIFIMLSLIIPIYAIYLAIKESSGKDPKTRIINIIAALFLAPIYILYVWTK
jgi:hypothetical protein